MTPQSSSFCAESVIVMHPSEVPEKRAAWYCHGYAICHPKESFEDAWQAWLEYELDAETDIDEDRHE